jgi:hypothetical protein
MPSHPASPWLWVGFGLSTLAGLLLSPATAPRQVTVEGATAEVRDHVKATLQRQIKTPWVWVPRTQMQSQLEAHPRVIRAELTSNVFGRAFVKVVSRQPQLCRDTDAALCLDQNGEWYRESVPAPETVGRVQVPDEFIPFNLAVVGTLPGQSWIDAYRRVRNKFPEESLTLAVDARGVLSLQLPDGPRLVLGTATRLDEKEKILGEFLTNEPEKIARAKVLNLSVPERPTLVP